MRVRVLFFAVLREKAKVDVIDWELPEGATVAALWRNVLAAHPTLEPFSASVSFAVNEEYRERDSPLHEGDEVALIPPVSGG